MMTSAQKRALARMCRGMRASRGVLRGDDGLRQLPVARGMAHSARAYPGGVVSAQYTPYTDVSSSDREHAPLDERELLPCLVDLAAREQVLQPARLAADVVALRLRGRLRGAEPVTERLRLTVSLLGAKPI